MTFRIKIDLGNAAMQTGPDVAQALRAVADELMHYEGQINRAAEAIMDGNGNVVGGWKVTRTN